MNCIVFITLIVGLLYIESPITNADDFSDKSSAGNHVQVAPQEESLPHLHDNNGPVAENSPMARAFANVKLPKIIDWTLYKDVFLKSYPTIKEELLRRRIFVMNTLKIFIHNLAFKAGLTTHYLGVNQFADVTLEESKKLFLKEDELFKLTRRNGGFFGFFNNIISNDKQAENSTATIDNMKKSLTEMLESDGQLDLAKYSALRAQLQKKINDHCKKIKYSRNYFPTTVAKPSPTEEKEIHSQPDQQQTKQNQDYVDWRQSNCLTTPKNQGNCNSCYAFATVSFMEWQHCRQTGNLIPFSEQYMVDCGKHVGLLGCRGGNVLDTEKFIDTWGIQLSSKFPYMAKESACPYEKDQWQGKSFKSIIKKQWRHMGADSSEWSELLKRGPLLVSFRVSKDFLWYGGKIHEGHICDVSVDGLAHLMLLVGHGIDEGKEYWLLRNSMGDRWGEGGYMRLSKQADELYFYHSTALEVEFQDN